MMTSQTNQSFRNSLKFTCLLLLGGSLGLVAGACRDDDEQGVINPEVEQDCLGYCDRAVECNDDKDEQECIDKCIERMNNCQADEQSQALAQLEVCANESCDDFLGCTIDVGTTCYFGL
jgi:hypothetical protein